MKTTLVAEGSSDRALLPVITWTLREVGVKHDLETNYADLSGLPSRPDKLADKVRLAAELFPCDLLIVHRDADNAGREARKEEIATAIGLLQVVTPYVALIPLKASEAWLLLDENALRCAAGNPYSNCALDLPNAREVERLADPKHTLFDQLRIASELTGRRLQKFNRNRARAQIAEYMDDFSRLRELGAFRAFEEDLRAIVPLVAEDQ